MVITVISLISLLLTECISNAAVIAILLPIGISLAKSMGIDHLRVMTLAGLAYCLPMGTPVNAIVYSSGFLSSREMIKDGAIIMAISWLLFLISGLLQRKQPADKPPAYPRISFHRLCPLYQTGSTGRRCPGRAMVVGKS